MKKRLFEIQTLSDNVRLSEPMTLIAILGSVTSLVGSLFPGMFRERLNMQHLNKLFPGNGYWTVKYKQFILSHIAYISGSSSGGMEFQEELIMKTHAFTNEVLRGTLCKDVPRSCWRPYADTFECPECLSILNNVLRQETFSGGTSPVGTMPGGGFGAAINYQQILIFGLGAVLLIALMKKKK